MEPIEPSDIRPLKIDLRVRVAGGEGVHIGEAKVARAVAPAIGLRLLPLDDGEGGIDVAHIVAVGDAIQMKEQGIQFGAQLQAALLVPDERRFDRSVRADMAHVAGEGCHVMRGVGQLQHGVPDDLPGAFRAEAHRLEPLRRHHRELFQDEPVEMLALNFLTRDKIEGYGIECGEQQRPVPYTEAGRFA